MTSKTKCIDLLISDLTGNHEKAVKVTGNPGITDCKYGKAVVFNGQTDGITLNEMPLAGLDQFTVEVVLRPDTGGNFEQRFVHLGEVQSDRVLLELRAADTSWYFDAFIKVGDREKALIDPALLHPLGQWAHLAYIYNKGKLESWVNSSKELESYLDVPPLKGGQTSIGMRQNEVSWFRGAIYKIRFTSKALKPDEFMVY
jgi:hypothetical protein